MTRGQTLYINHQIMKEMCLENGNRIYPGVSFKNTYKSVSVWIRKIQKKEDFEF